MDQATLSGWITAAATGVTAVLTGTGGLAAWIVLRRERRREMPIVERAVRWEGERLWLVLAIRNRLPETIMLDRIEVTSPREATISPQFGSTVDALGGRTPSERGTKPHIMPGSLISPVGTARNEYTPGDTGYLNFPIWPPVSWSSGELWVALWISSKAGTIRSRRVRFRLRVEERPPPLDHSPTWRTAR